MKKRISEAVSFLSMNTILVKTTTTDSFKNGSRWLSWNPSRNGLKLNIDGSFKDMVMVLLVELLETLKGNGL